jgi:tetratricopeptide (TPR) repeat protein
LAPSLAENLALSAAILVKSGQPEKAFDRIRKAMRLCPIYPSWYVWILGTACRLTGRDDTAVRAFKEAIRRSPDYPAPHVSLTSTLADLGREDEAKKSANKLLRILPEFSISDYMGGLHYKYPTDAERFEAGLRKAGLPE